MNKFFLFVLAVLVLYFGVFIYEEVGPLLYALMLTILASIPLLLKFSFWKKILFMVPLLILRVIGKILLMVFGKNALSKLLARYGLLEKRFEKTLSALFQTRDNALVRWKLMSRQSQAYLILIFLPVGLVLLFVSLLIKVLRLKFLQFFIEKIMQRLIMRWTVDGKRKQKPGTSDPDKNDPDKNDRPSE